MLRSPPEILVTTPESLNILLTSRRGRELLGGLRTVILDEVHAVADSKRGVHLITAVERLARLSGEVQRVALSATVRPARAGGALGRRLPPRGGRRPRPPTDPGRSRSCDAGEPKRYELAVAVAARGDQEISPWEPVATRLRATVLRNRSTLVFANSRRTVEKLTRLVNEQGRRPARLVAPRLAVARDPPGRRGAAQGGRAPRHRRHQLARAGDRRRRPRRGGAGAGRPRRSCRPCSASAAPATGSARPAAALLPAVRPRPAQRGGAGAGGPGRRDRGATPGAAPPSTCWPRWCCRWRRRETWTVDRAPRIPAHRVALPPICTRRQLRPGARDARRPLRRDPAPRAAAAGRSSTASTARCAPGPAPSARSTAPAAPSPTAATSTCAWRARGAPIGELDEEFVWERSVGDAFTLGVQSWRIERITHNDVFVTPGRRAQPRWRRSGGPTSATARSHLLASGSAAFLEQAEAAARTRPSSASELEDEPPPRTRGRRRRWCASSRPAAATGALPHRHRLVVEQIAGPAGRGRPSPAGAPHPLGRPRQPAARPAPWPRPGRSASDSGREVIHDDDCVVLDRPGDDAARPQLLRWLRPAALEACCAAAPRAGPGSSARASARRPASPCCCPGRASGGARRSGSPAPARQGAARGRRTVGGTSRWCSRPGAPAWRTSSRSGPRPSPGRGRRAARSRCAAFAPTRLRRSRPPPCGGGPTPLMYEDDVPPAARGRPAGRGPPAGGGRLRPPAAAPRRPSSLRRLRPSSSAPPPATPRATPRSCWSGSRSGWRSRCRSGGSCSTRCAATPMWTRSSWWPR